MAYNFDENQDEGRQPSSSSEDQQQQQQRAIKDQILRRFVDPQARQRLNNVRLVKPDLASTVENYVVNLASQGRINRQITDDELKQILQSVQQPKRDFRINRV